VRSSVEAVEPTRVKISVVVEPDELAPAIDRTFRRLAREIRVPGFRQGKVPRRVMEARIGREAIVADAIENEAVPEFYQKALDELDITPLSRAQVDMDDYADGSPLEFSATVEVKPEVDLPPYERIEVEQPRAEVTDEQVNEQLDRLRERFAQLEVIGRPLAKGDFAQIDLRGTRHTEEIPELTQSDWLYEVGSERLVPEVDRELEGKRKGDILRFNATLPEGAGEKLAGQEVTLQVLVKEAKAKVLPDLDDDFAAEASEFDTLDELRDDLRQRMEQVASAQVAAETESRVLTAYLDMVDVPLPEALVNDELRYRLARLTDRLQAAGVSLEQYLQMTGTPSEQLMNDLQEEARRAVKAQLVLEAVAKAEGMEVTDQEVEEHLREQAERLGRPVSELRKTFSGNRAGVIRGDILRTRALALLVERATLMDAPAEDASAQADTAAQADEQAAAETEDRGSTQPPEGPAGKE
jgi:trigger factor